MFERYTEKARRAIFFARFEASQYGSHSIEVPHLLLGLLREQKALFGIPGVDSKLLHQAIEALCVRSGDQISTSVDLPLAPACQRVLTLAAEEAETLSHRYIGTGHLLLGVLRENGPEASALGKLGITIEAVLTNVVKDSPVTAPVNRQTLHDLLADVPDERLWAAAELITGLSSEVFVANGVSGRGPFQFRFGIGEGQLPPSG